MMLVRNVCYKLTVLWSSCSEVELGWLQLLMNIKHEDKLLS